jgi:hypothetical protein
MVDHNDRILGAFGAPVLTTSLHVKEAFTYPWAYEFLVDSQGANIRHKIAKLTEGNNHLKAQMKEKQKQKAEWLRVAQEATQHRDARLRRVVTELRKHGLTDPKLLPGAEVEIAAATEHVYTIQKAERIVQSFSVYEHGLRTLITQNEEWIHTLAQCFEQRETQKIITFMRAGLPMSEAVDKVIHEALAFNMEVENDEIRSALSEVRLAQEGVTNATQVSAEQQITELLSSMLSMSIVNTVTLPVAGDETWSRVKS